MQMNKMIRILDHPVRADNEVFTKYIGYRTPLEGNPFQRRDHLALSSLRFALGQALSAAKDLCPARDPSLRSG